MIFLTLNLLHKKLLKTQPIVVYTKYILKSGVDVVQLSLQLLEIFLFRWKRKLVTVLLTYCNALFWICILWPKVFVLPSDIKLHWNLEKYFTYWIKCWNIPVMVIHQFFLEFICFIFVPCIFRFTLCIFFKRHLLSFLFLFVLFDIWPQLFHFQKWICALVCGFWSIVPICRFFSWNFPFLKLTPLLCFIKLSKNRI